MQIHIASCTGGPLDVADSFGADFNSVDLIGKTFKVRHATVEEIVIELVTDEVPNGTPSTFRRKVMNQQEMTDSPKDYGPYRELAKTTLSLRIKSLKQELAGFEALLKIAEKLENGSPAEYQLWSLLQRNPF